MAGNFILQVLINENRILLKTSSGFPERSCFWYMVALLVMQQCRRTCRYFFLLRLLQNSPTFSTWIKNLCEFSKKLGVSRTASYFFLFHFGALNLWDLFQNPAQPSLPVGIKSFLTRYFARSDYNRLLSKPPLFVKIALCESWRFTAIATCRPNVFGRSLSKWGW